ncbi:MAG: hypothetical protein M1820_008345 [Bogoriella megaspora]|nr:MAG: hypothetical protein M1820_008345 [Bogoriella megaspora]
MSDTTNITCYDYDGTNFTEFNKCPNSDSCFKEPDQCLPTRLVKRGGDLLVRPICANNPWSQETCAQICLYGNKGGYVPRVNICQDGSYCCDNDPNCCLDHTGVFLNQTNGIVIGRANETTNSATHASSTSTSTMPPKASSVVTQYSDSSLSTGAKAGIGVGVAVAALLIIAAIIGILWKRRNRKNANGSISKDVGAKSPVEKPRGSYELVHPVEMEATGQISELPGASTVPELPGNAERREAD